jgi:hypothetical protein
MLTYMIEIDTDDDFYVVIKGKRLGDVLVAVTGITEKDVANKAIDFLSSLEILEKTGKELKGTYFMADQIGDALMSLHAGELVFGYGGNRTIDMYSANSTPVCNLVL